MKIDEIKKEMLAYRDFFGGDLLDRDSVKKARTKKELANIIETHRDHLEMQVNDAGSHLDNFKRRIGLYFLD